MVDFAAEGLLEGLDGSARAARERLLRALHDDGVGLDELRAAVAEDRLVLLPTERRIGGSGRYTPQEIAERADVPAELLAGLRRTQGLPVPGPEERVLTDADLAAARTAKAFVDAGIPAQDMLEVSRVLGRGLTQAAEVMRAITLELVLEPGTEEDQLALRYADAAAQLTPLTQPMVGEMLVMHLRHVAQTELLNAAEREAGRLPGARDVTVAFADLVGFTRMGEEVAPDELGRIADRLERLAGDLLEPPVRLVKTIGDAVMLVSPEPEPLLTTALDLVDAAEREGDDLPQLRAGLARGPALARAGDWFGSPVNLASRITGRARAGSVLVTKDLRELEPAGIAFSFAGEKRLRGVREPVALYRARHADGR